MSKSSEPTRLNYADIEEFRRVRNKTLWGSLIFLGLTTIISLSALVAIALRPVPVIAFDKDGKMMLFKDTLSPGMHTDPIRVEHFARTFLELFVGVDATRLEEDLRKALNMMTPLTRDLILTDGQQIRRRKSYKNTDIRSRFGELEIRVAEFDPADYNSEIHLYAWGRQDFARIFGKKDDPVSQYVFIKMILERHPVRRVTPYGLLVRYIEYDSFAEQRQLDVAKLKVMKD